MDNMHHISEDDPNLLVDKIGILENGYHPSEMGYSLLLDLDDSDGEKRLEYRYRTKFSAMRLKYGKFVCNLIS